MAIFFKRHIDLELTPRCIVRLSEDKNMTIKEVCAKYNLSMIWLLKNLIIKLDAMK